MMKKALSSYCLFTLLGLVLLAPSPAHAGKALEYKEGATTLEGWVVTPRAKKKAPAVVIVHEWDGLGDYVKSRAKQIADLGYVAFGADIYGKGVRPKDADESAKFAHQYRSDRPLLRKRVRAAIDAVAKLKEVDPARIAVIGYCFGGTAALEAARDQAPIVGAVSFHGGLGTPLKAPQGLKPKILVLHGADDPLVPADEVTAFTKEMKDAGADWQFVSYSGAVHSFTNPATPWKPGMPFGYHATADRRSWIALGNFLKEIFQ